MDGTLFKIFKKYDSDGYYIYFRVVEILANGDHLIEPKKNVREWWEHEIMKSWETIEPVLDMMSDEGMIILEKSEEISVFSPKLGELNPEWLRKLEYRELKKSGTVPELFRNKSGLKESKVNESKVNENKKDIDPRVKILIDYFFNKHLEVKKSKITISGGKDGIHFKDLLKTWTEQEIKDHIDAFMTYADKWMNDKPYSIGIFKSQFDKLGSAKKVEANPDNIFGDKK